MFLQGGLVQQQWPRRLSYEMSQSFPASLWGTGLLLHAFMGHPRCLSLVLTQTGLFWSVDPLKLTCWSSYSRLSPCRKIFTFCLLFPVHLLRRMLRNPFALNWILEGHMPQWLQTYLPAHHLLMAQVPGLPCVFSLPLFLPARSPLSIFTSVPHSLVCLVFVCSSQLFFMQPYASAASIAFLCSWLQCSVTEEELPRLNWAGALGLEMKSSKNLPTPPDI